MSYDIYLCDDAGKILELDERHQLRGGTYCLGGTTECTLNITYNYAPFFRRMFGADGIRWLYGQRAKETTQALERATEVLRGEPSGDYWEATEGNARKALLDLLELARMRPDGIWGGD